MSGKILPVLADPRLIPSDARTIATFLGGLSGAALVAAIIGGLIGYGAACKIDPLPAGLGIALGIFGMLLIVAYVPV